MPRLPGREPAAVRTFRSATLGEIAARGRATRREAEPTPTRPAKPRKLCTVCGLNPKRKGHALWCDDCWLRRQGAEVQSAAAARRLAAVPADQHQTIAQAGTPPDGRRWCAGCQSFRLQLDFKNTATRCAACAATQAHRTRTERVYGLTPVEYDRVWKSQGGRCAICRNRFPTRRPAVDHDHQTGAPRGLLCDRCNHDLLGAAKDQLRILEAAVYYLRHPPYGGQWRTSAVDIWSDEPPPF